jgi:hypothetical protein
MVEYLNDTLMTFALPFAVNEIEQAAAGFSARECGEHPEQRHRELLLRVCRCPWNWTVRLSPLGSFFEQSPNLCLRTFRTLVAAVIQ